MRACVVLAVALLLALGGGCGGGGNCSFQILARIAVELTVDCCGASAWDDVTIRQDDVEIDIAFHMAAGAPPPVHAWLTTPGCTSLFEGEYPPASGSPAPRCAVYLGPVSPGEVSARRKLPPGTYRVWLQAFSRSPEPLKCFLDVGVWGERCGGATRRPSSRSSILGG
jgi:hypothetical protein